MQDDANDSRAALARLQQRLGDALTARDPVAHWREHLPSLPLDENGLRLAALLVTKLRFQRLVAASERAESWFAGGLRPPSRPLGRGGAVRKLVPAALVSGRPSGTTVGFFRGAASR